MPQYNTGALKAAGGKDAGLTMTISTMQLGVCAAYAIILWVVRINPINLCGLQMPAPQEPPKINAADFVKTIPVGEPVQLCEVPSGQPPPSRLWAANPCTSCRSGFCSAAAHSSSVFALGGDPLFGQIVKVHGRSNAHKREHLIEIKARGQRFCTLNYFPPHPCLLL